MAQFACNRCGKSPARVAVVAYRYIPFVCAPCAVAIAKDFAARGERVRIDALAPGRINDNVDSSGAFHASEADCRAAQRALDARAISFARRVGAVVARLELARRAA